MDTSDPQAVTLSIGTVPAQQQLALRYTVSPAAFSVGVTAGLELDVAGLGITGTAQVTVDGTGLRLAAITIGIDPAKPLVIGGAAIAPFAGFAGGADAAGGARAEAGIAVSADGHVHALVATLLLGPPLTMSAGTQTDGQPDPVPDIAAIVTGFIIPALADVALADSSVTAVLSRPALGGLTVQDLLEGVLLTGGQFDPGALDLSQAVQRLLRLGGNVANADPHVTIGDHLTIEIAHDTNGATTTYGVGVTVDPGQSVPITTGDLILAVEVDSTWTAILGSASPGLSVLLLDDTSGSYRIAASPAVLVNGVGLRVSRGSGPLLDTGLQIGSVALYGLLDISAQGVQASGGKLELAGLAVAVAGAAGGDNAVAQGVLGDAASGGSGGPGDNTPLQPQFSPALALEKPRRPATWSLRAGDGTARGGSRSSAASGRCTSSRSGSAWTRTARPCTDCGCCSTAACPCSACPSTCKSCRSARNGLRSQTDKALTDPHAWSIDLAGLAVGYSGGSVSLAGALRKSGSPPDYIGVLIAHIGPYGLTAFGGYGQFLAPDGSRYTSLFVVAGITAPIGGPPAFFVTGLGGGAGHYWQLVLLATLVDDFPSYPPVAAIDPHSTLASDPQHALDELSAAFPPQRGNFWFAAGLSFTSFAGPDGHRRGRSSSATGSRWRCSGWAGWRCRPPTRRWSRSSWRCRPGSPPARARSSWLPSSTQNSWILTSDCRLTGGFAYASFFGTNPNAGQFVLSIGGYHPSFHHDGYPSVPRVGYIWSVASALTISGQSYFALTSEAIMAGTWFTAALDLGFLWASLTLGVDAIVYFDPFQFSADGYASIAAGVTIDIDLGWFGSIEVSLSFHLGATVHVQGPTSAARR